MPKYVVLQENGVESDPLSEAELVQWARDGRVQPATLIRDCELRQWHQAKDMPIVAATGVPVESASTDSGVSASAFVESSAPGVTTSPMPNSEEPPPDERHNTGDVPSSMPNNPPPLPVTLLPLLAAAGLALIILFVSGWSVRTGYAPMKVVDGHVNSAVSNFGFIDERGIAITINRAYHGLFITNRFVHSPGLSWIGMILSCFILYVGLVASGRKSDVASTK